MSTSKFPTLYTTAEAADMLRVNQATLRWWRSKGLGPRPTPIGGRIRYRESDLLAFIDGQQADAAAVG